MRDAHVDVVVVGTTDSFVTVQQSRRGSGSPPLATALERPKVLVPACPCLFCSRQIQVQPPGPQAAKGGKHPFETRRDPSRTPRLIPRPRCRTHQPRPRPSLAVADGMVWV